MDERNLPPAGPPALTTNAWDAYERLDQARALIEPLIDASLGLRSWAQAVFDHLLIMQDEMDALCEVESDVVACAEVGP